MPYNQKGNCWRCGQALGENDFSRQSNCPDCGAATHVCRNCRHFSRSAPNQCREPVADPVSDKQRANFCGYFEAVQQSARQEDDQESLRQAADDLFDI